jgi:alkylation response protein AidB-like acyl-CoA dehydrogenase
MLPAFAHLEPGGRWADAATCVTAAQEGDAWRLTGVKEPVPRGARSDLLVVSAALPDGGGTGLFLVEGDDAGTTRDGYATHDGGRAARVAFDGASTTAYLTSRKQFGVTLNKFQALTFRAADMYVSLEMARSLTLWAGLVLLEGRRRSSCTGASA